MPGQRRGRVGGVEAQQTVEPRLDAIAEGIPHGLRQRHLAKQPAAAAGRRAGAGAFPRPLTAAPAASRRKFEMSFKLSARPVPSYPFTVEHRKTR